MESFCLFLLKALELLELLTRPKCSRQRPYINLFEVKLELIIQSFFNLLFTTGSANTSDILENSAYFHYSFILDFGSKGSHLNNYYKLRIA